MKSTSRKSLVVMTLCLVLALSTSLLTADAATSPVFPSNGLTASGLKQTTINGYAGVLVNYTSTFTTPFTAFVYLVVDNAAGQTVYIGFGTFVFTGNTTMVQGFIGISPPLHTGTYTANIFATTSARVPVSATSSLPLTV